MKQLLLFFILTIANYKTNCDKIEPAAVPELKDGVNITGHEGHICKLIESKQMDRIHLASFTYEEMYKFGFKDMIRLGDYAFAKRLVLIADDKKQTDSQQYRYTMEESDLGDRSLKLPETILKLQQPIKAGYYIFSGMVSDHSPNLILTNRSLYISTRGHGYRDLEDHIDGAPNHSFSIASDRVFVPEQFASFYLFSQDVFKQTPFTVIYHFQLWLPTHWHVKGLLNAIGKFLAPGWHSRQRIWHNISPLPETRYFYMIQTEQPDKVLFLKSLPKQGLDESYQLFRDGLPEASFVHNSSLYLFDGHLACVYIIREWHWPSLDETYQKYDRFEKPRLNVPYEEYFKCSGGSGPKLSSDKYPSNRCETRAGRPMTSGGKAGVVEFIVGGNTFENWTWFIAFILIIIFIALFCGFRMRKSRKTTSRNRSQSIAGKQGKSVRTDSSNSSARPSSKSKSISKRK